MSKQSCWSGSRLARELGAEKVTGTSRTGLFCASVTITSEQSEETRIDRPALRAAIDDGDVRRHIGCVGGKPLRDQRVDIGIHLELARGLIGCENGADGPVGVGEQGDRTLTITEDATGAGPASDGGDGHRGSGQGVAVGILHS